VSLEFVVDPEVVPPLEAEPLFIVLPLVPGLVVAEGEVLAGLLVVPVPALLAVAPVLLPDCA
jgi:hypothetical protein